MIEKKTFKIIAGVILTILSLMCVLPFVLMISGSLTGETALLVEGYKFIPTEWSWAAYNYLFMDAHAENRRGKESTNIYIYQKYDL